MRFNIRKSNYSRAGKAAADEVVNIHAAARRNSPDYGKMVQQAANIRSAVKRAGISAAADVSVAGINAAAKVEKDKIVGKAKRGLKKAKRKAGALGVAGSMFNQAGTLLGEKRDRREVGSEDSFYDSLTEKNDSKLADLRKQLEDLKPPSATDSTQTSNTSSSTSTKTGESTSSGTATSAGTGALTTGFRSEVYSYLTKDKGLDQNQALGLMANIDRESSFRINPQGGDGGNSFGMFQWNNSYGRSDIMKQNVSNWQTNWKGQIDHALSGNQLPEYNSVTSQYLNTKFNSPQEASEFWLRNWERPAHVDRDIQTNNSFLQGYNF